MGFLNIGRKDSGGRQKRIEHRGKYLRVSRTGGVALRAQKKIAGINVTGNTKNGLRLSTRVAKKTQIALQNGRFVLRGRYGPDAAKLNVSKSGVSVSSKTAMGSFNWISPSRSSFKFAGIQLRGKKAALLQFFYLAAKLLYMSLRGLVAIIYRLCLAAGRFGLYAWTRLWHFCTGSSDPQMGVRHARDAGKSLLLKKDINLSEYEKNELYRVLSFILINLARGITPIDINRDDKTPLFEWVASNNSELDAAELVGLACLIAEAWAVGVEEPDRIEALYSLDELCLEKGPKTNLQEKIINCLFSAFQLAFVSDSESGRSNELKLNGGRQEDEH